MYTIIQAVHSLLYSKVSFLQCCPIENDIIFKGGGTHFGEILYMLILGVAESLELYSCLTPGNRRRSSPVWALC